MSPTNQISGYASGNNFNIFLVLSSTAQSHMQEFTLGPLSETRSVPGGRQLVGQAANLIF